MNNELRTPIMNIETLTADSEWSEYKLPERTIAVAAVGLMVILSELLFPGGMMQLLTALRGDLSGTLVEVAPEIEFIILLIAIHEVTHYLVTIRNGHSPQFGLQFQKTFWLLREPVPYVIALNQRISRNENIRALIAPVVVINTIAAGVLLVPVPEIINYYARLALVVNTAGSIQDLYNVGRLLGLPETTEFVNLAEEEIRTFYTIQSNS